MPISSPPQTLTGSPLASQYTKAKANLWVEDQTTRAVLQALWLGEGKIKIYVAGGLANVHSMVADARQSGIRNVFGFCDRDFGSSNRSAWRTHMTLDLFRSDGHEIENFLLDADAIAACDVNTAGLTPAQVDAKLAGIVNPPGVSPNPFTWWLACRRVMGDMHQRVTDGFPGHPTRGNVRSKADALVAIEGTNWWQSVRPHLSDPWDVSKDLDNREADYRAMLSTDQWKQEFSGKELLRELATAVWTKEPPEKKGMHDEFARAIARQLQVSQRVPKELNELKSAILMRVGLAPAGG